MRLEYLLAAALMLTACGGRKIDAPIAAGAIAGIPEEILKKKDVAVLNINQVGGSEAIVETNLRAAFRLEKVRNKWVVREVRIGHGQWEKIGSFERALEMVRIEETRKMLDRIADAIQKYRANKGNLPPFTDYVSLSDALSPSFLTPLIRMDAWRRPLAADHQGANAILLRSAGPDGKLGTADDVIKSIP